MARVLSKETLDAIDRVAAKYPTRMAALLPAIHLTMDSHGHVTDDGALDIAESLDIPPVQVHEVVTFYTMFYNRPIGRHTIKICRNLACQLRGADGIIQKAVELLGIELGETTADGRITLDTDECLASCGTGPMLWCRSRKEDSAPSEYIVERLSLEKLEQLLGSLS